jgi:DivIVA domain-containing protein
MDRRSRSLDPVATRHTDMTGIELGASAMRQFTRDDIIAHRFTSGRRKGYDTLEVDGYLQSLAEYVGWMQTELVRHQASERAALDVLLQAQRVADETVASAQRDADKLRQNAADGLENARRDALATLEAARAEADRSLLSAQVEAESAVERSRSQIAELEVEGAARLDSVNRLVEELRGTASECASAFRSASSRLLEMADHFESQFDRREGIEAHHEGSIEFAEERVDVT